MNASLRGHNITNVVFYLEIESDHEKIEDKSKMRNDLLEKRRL